VLSNTMRPETWHEHVLHRDGVLDLIDGAAHTKEIDWTKPAHEALRAAMAAVRVTDPGPNSDVPPFAADVPDAVIGRLVELRPLVESW